MMVLAIDDSNVNRIAGQRARGIQSGETRADNNDFASHVHIFTSCDSPVQCLMNLISLKQSEVKLSASTTKATSENVQRGVMPLVEVAIAFAILECALWSPKTTQLVFGLITLAWIGFCTWRSARGPRELGVSIHGLAASLWTVPLILALCGAALVAASMAGSLHGLMGARAPVWHALLYSIWALVQEFLTLSFIFVRLEDALGTNGGIVATAALFSLAHIPNLLLILVTVPMSLAACWVFSRYRNIYAVAVCHAILGLTISVTLPPALTHSMRVGISYYFR